MQCNGYGHELTFWASGQRYGKKIHTVIGEQKHYPSKARRGRVNRHIHATAASSSKAKRIYKNDFCRIVSDHHCFGVSYI